MHFEVLVEDLSGKIALEILLPKIVGYENTCKIISYKGIGKIPKDLRGVSDPKHRILLDQLPRILQGYGKTSQYSGSNVAVIVVCDLDRKCLKSFRAELDNLLAHCSPRPNAYFCVAIEEGEAWLFGDIPAIKKAYPKAKDHVLHSYENDSICGTWELLEKAIGSGSKTTWAKDIPPHMNIQENKSPSFVYFRDKLRKLAINCCQA